MVVLYDSYDVADDFHVTNDPIVCHCLRVRESQLLASMAVSNCETVRDITRETGAGSGCTACRCVLKQYLAQRMAHQEPAA